MFLISGCAFFVSNRPPPHTAIPLFLFLLCQALQPPHLLHVVFKWKHADLGFDQVTDLTIEKETLGLYLLFALGLFALWSTVSFAAFGYIWIDYSPVHFRIHPTLVAAATPLINTGDLIPSAAVQKQKCKKKKCVVVHQLDLTVYCNAEHNST